MTRLVPTVPGSWRVRDWGHEPSRIVTVRGVEEDDGSIFFGVAEDEDNDVELPCYDWLHRVDDRERSLCEEIDALRRQVAAHVANGVSIAKAADRARQAERASIVTYLRDLVDDEPESSAGWELVHLLADRILRGAHEVES